MSQVVDPTDYIIKTRFEVQGNVPGLDRVHSQLTRMEGLVGGLGRSITGNLLGAFAGIAGIAGIGSLVKQVVGLNSEIQNAEFGIASLFSSLAKMPMNQALGLAKDQLKGLRQEAAAGVGELSDYVEGFQMILGPAGAAGASVDKVRELNRLSLAAGFALRGQAGLKQAPLDIVQALTSGAHDRTTPIVEQALRSVGISDTKFNAMGSNAKIEALLKGFGTFKAAAEAMGGTWDAKMATFRDAVKDIARIVTEPLFNKWTDDLTDANNWLQRNRALINDIADGAGKKLSGAHDAVVANAGLLGTAGAGAAAAVGGGRLTGAAAGALGLGGPGAIIAGLAAAMFGFIGSAVTAAIRKFPELGQRLSSHFGVLVGAFGQLGDAVLKLFANPWMAEFGTRFASFGDALLKTGIVITRFISAMVEQFDFFLRIAYLGGKAFEALTSGDRAGAEVLFAAAKATNATGGAVFANRMSGLLDFNGAAAARDGKKDQPPVSEPPIF
ncbi:MAG: hypothetical protein ABL982_22195, partial [Vicinamibacterales bacterium]